MLAYPVFSHQPRPTRAESPLRPDAGGGRACCSARCSSAVAHLSLVFFLLALFWLGLSLYLSSYAAATEALSHADQFHRRAVARSGHRRLQSGAAHLRALRPLHRDLPDLPAAWRRTRQSARTHLPDQGHAGDRPAGHRGGGAPCRSLPLLPRLHDHLSVRRELHAPGGSRAQLHRADLSPAVARACIARRAGRGAAATGAVPRWRCSARALVRPLARLLPGSGRLGRRLRAMLALVPDTAAAAQRDCGAAGPSRAGRTPRPRGTAGRLRPAGAGARDQRGHDPPADPARRRGRGGARRRLLRRADPPHGAARPRPWRVRARTSPPGAARSKARGWMRS